MMYANKTFYFAPDCDFVAMAERGEYDAVLKVLEGVKLEAREVICDRISANYKLQPFCDAKEIDKDFRDYVISNIFVPLFVEAEDYNSLEFIAQHKEYCTPEVRAVLEKYERYRAITRDTFENKMACKPFEVAGPFPMKFDGSKLTFVADNGIEYRVYRIDVSEFGKIG